MSRILEDIIITSTLLKRFEAEAHVEGGDGRYYALIPRDDGSLLAHHPASPQLAPGQAIWAQDVLKLLNREVHHDGAWVVVFTHVQPHPLETVIYDPKHWDYGRYALIWLDEDGDPQFTVEWERGVTSDFQEFEDVLLAGLQSSGQRCETAWATWRLYMRDVLDPREGETFKRAKGQRAPSARH